MTVVVALIAVVVLVVGSGAVGRWLRARAHAVRDSDAETPEKVHRLQRLLMMTSGLYFVGVLASVGAGALVAATQRHRHVAALWAAIVVVVGMIVLLTAMIMTSRAVRRELAAVRDTPARPQGSRRQAVVGLCIGLGWGAILVVGNLLVPAHGLGHVIGHAVVYVVGLLLLTSVVVPLVVVRLSSKPLTGETAQRLTALAAESGVRVRGFRVLDSRGQKVANAAQVGTIPGFRYILLSDYLLDNLPPREVDAVVAHELGHARRHHILIKLGAVLLVWAVLEAAAVGVGAAVGHGAGALLVVPIFIAIPVGILLAQGLVGVRLEEAADDHAADLVGAGELAAALERVGDLNDTKRNTGRAWALLTQHPGLDVRLQRLRERSTPSAAAA